MHREMLVSGLAMSVEVFSLILKEVKKARSSYRVSYKEENKTISYDIENRFVIFANCSNNWNNLQK